MPGMRRDRVESMTPPDEGMDFKILPGKMTITTTQTVRPVIWLGRLKPATRDNIGIVLILGPAFLLMLMGYPYQAMVWSMVVLYISLLQNIRFRCDEVKP